MHFSIGSYQTNGKIISASKKFISTLACSGTEMQVFKITDCGRQEKLLPCIRAHDEQINEIDFSCNYDNLLLSCSKDAKVSIDVKK